MDGWMNRKMMLCSFTLFLCIYSKSNLVKRCAELVEQLKEDERNMAAELRSKYRYARE